MNTYKVQLKDNYDVEGGELEFLLADAPYDQPAPEWRRPMVVVVPGGGYWMVSKREGVPVASRFFAKGYQVCVLTYLCNPDGARYPEQLAELAAAVDYVKKNAEKMHVNPDEIFIVGFSAGGHLTADLAVEWQCVKQKTGMDLDCRPRAVGLAYPVISHKTCHADSYKNLLDGYTEEAKAELEKELSLEDRVTEDTPPAFLWTTVEDSCVPPENTLLFALSLQRNKIPYELHVYPKGDHGASTCDWEINPACAPFMRKNAQWTDDCADFFRSYCVEKF